LYISVCIISTFAFGALTQLAGCKGAEKGQMGEEDGSFCRHQLDEVGALNILFFSFLSEIFALFYQFILFQPVAHLFSAVESTVLIYK